jgi:hypothetical protein
MRTAGWLLFIVGLTACPFTVSAQTLGGDSEGMGGASGAHAAAPSCCPVLQSRDEAWWTGPMVANSAETLPPGHFLFEPYFYQVRAAHWSLAGSSAYLLYGLANDLSVGLIPIVGYQRIDGGGRSSRLALGDVALSAQYRLTHFHEGSWLPTVALNVQEILPTGKYDQLGNRPADGLGSGVYATMVALNTQTYFWLSNGRILRTRLDLSQTFANDNASVDGVSVYGTEAGFRGHGRPGATFSSDLAFEYSVTQHWVAALDLLYTHNRSTRVTGYDLTAGGASGPVIRTDSGSSSAYGLAPAVEYNVSSSLGVLLGARVIRGLHNATNTLTPALAVNYVH